MRTGVWSWCAPPRRRRRQQNVNPPPAISLCPPMPPKLSDFAEGVTEEAGLSDIDFSHLDDDVFDTPQNQPVPMLTDDAAGNWMGDQAEFERFHQIVGDIRVDDRVVPDKSVFNVPEQVFEHWCRNGHEHNVWFSKGTTGHGLDIRDLAHQFSKRHRRKTTS